MTEYINSLSEGRPHRPPNTATGKCYACGAIIPASQLTRQQGRAIGSGKHNYCPKCAELRKRGL